jgi:hypothetical protein
LREWLPRNGTKGGPKQRRRDRAFVIFHVPAEAHTRGKVPPTQRSAWEKLDFKRQPFAHQLFVFVTLPFLCGLVVSAKPDLAHIEPHVSTRICICTDSSSPNILQDVQFGPLPQPQPRRGFQAPRRALYPAIQTYSYYGVLIRRSEKFTQLPSISLKLFPARFVF